MTKKLNNFVYKRIRGINNFIILYIVSVRILEEIEQPSARTNETKAGPRNGITIKKIEQNLKDLKERDSTKEVEEEGKVIEGLDFNFEDKDEDDGKSKMLRVREGSDGVVIKRCRFRNKANKDPALVIGNSKNVVVEDCIFENMEGGNEREAIRIAEDGRESGLSLKCTVRRCIFRNNKGDPEIISIKSAENIVEDCFFINNDGNVTVRHGGLAVIRHNYFEGKNGVRIHGYGNRVEYNCFKDNSAEDEGQERKRTPISLWWGGDDKDSDKDKDPYWNWVDRTKKISKPSGNKGDETIDRYAQTVDTVIRGNEFKNCKNTIVEVKGEGPKEPLRTMNEDNRKLKEDEKFGFETEE
jgi:hypothetical protein